MRHARVSRGGAAAFAGRRLFPYWCAAGATLLIVAAIAAPAAAQVFEVGSGGTVVYAGPAVFDRAGVRPIVLQGPPRRSTRGRQAVFRRSSPRTAGSALAEAANAAELSPELIEAVAWRESGGRSGAMSRAGAIGEMQLLPGTARMLGVDPLDSRANYRGGAAYLRLLMKRYDGDVVRALSAYNAGPGAVERYGGTPPFRETQAYVAAVLERLSRRAVEGE